MAKSLNIFTTIRTEGALLPADLLQRISEGATLDGLTPQSYHRLGEKLNEAINRSWNALQGVWASFRAAQERLPETDAGTTLTRERWLLPLFRELDYGRLQTASAAEIDGRSYPISHGWEHVPIHLVSYKLELDKRTPGATGAASASPHSLLQVFLNRSDAHLWGFVSNGYKLRILRDNVSLTRQAYVEFDLEAMMDGEVYSDFVLLWLLCHQSRVEGERPSDGWLEKWMKVAEEQGTRALDQLRDGVEKAITALGLGFLEYPGNAALRDKLTSGELSAQDYYRQLLRMVYRLLFLFVAEDRDLLLNPNAPQAARERYIQYYSTQRLRRMAETFKGTRHPDLFEGLRQTMVLLSGDGGEAAAGLGLIPLGSFLFSDRAVTDVIGCQIANSHLLTAVRALSLTDDQRSRVYRTVDYRNLGSDELGSIFESLLELHPQINIPARRFALSTAAGNERKTTGSYYTPESLVHALLDSALNPVLAEATKKGEAAILDLKVCDPACGSGHFLIAAANRMAKALAFVRTGEEEPTPSAVQEAKRDIISHCIYGVDINPMAVELCKVNLWMEALEPGKPLNFLDHRIQVGNSLLGTTPKLMAGGIPDEAFNPIEGDDPKYAATLKKVNKQERKDRASGQRSMFELVEPPANYGYLTEAMHALDGTPDDTLDAVRRKEAQYAALASDPEYIKARVLADAWCAAFVWEKKQTGSSLPMTDLLYRRMEDNPLADNLQTVREVVVQLKERYQFFHWHVAFPDVFTVLDDPASAENEQTGWQGGFDCVLGNPPWEHTEIKEKEWFNQRAPQIANASGAKRKRMIEALGEADPYLFAAFGAEKRISESFAHFTRMTGRYPLTARGRSNTYPLFAETSRHIINPVGQAGMIVPSGIATDDTTKFFFQDLIQTHTLVSLYDFENREGLFPAVDSRMKFALVTMSGHNRPIKQAEFVFFALNVGELTDAWRRFKLSDEDIALLNPNTGTMATFRSVRDAEITKSIYKRVPVLIREDPMENLWSVNLKQGLFNMTSDSGLFRTVEQLGSAGYALEGNHFVRLDDWEGIIPIDSPITADERIITERYLPLYEAKMTHIFDHRFSRVVLSETALIRQGQPEYLTMAEHIDPYNLPLPRYWVATEKVDDVLKDRWSYSWILGWRDVSSSTNERTTITSIIPKSGVGDKFLIAFPNTQPSVTQALYSTFASLIFDYVSRQKLGGNALKFFVFRQIPAIPPHTYTPALLDFIVPRVLELTYTAWDLQPFAQDVGYQGAPFIWDEERRFIMRCELDALYFHLYQISRDDVDYIMETFPIVKRKDEAAHGEYRTKRVILEMYDQMAALPVMHVPAPKDESATYAVPDVSQWASWLNPGPADPRVAHPEER